MGNELVKIDSTTYRKQVSRCISAMLAVLDSYGRKESGALLDGWLMALQSREFPYEWLEPTCIWYCTHGGSFPTPGGFIDMGAELHEREIISAQLAATTLREKELDAQLAEDRRRRNIECGIDPDVLLPIDSLKEPLQGLTARMLPERENMEAPEERK